MLRLFRSKYNSPFYLPVKLYAHSKTCPASKQKTCPGSGGAASSGGGGGGDVKMPDFKRAEKSGPVRFGFLPDEWFTFFHSITGVSGPYVFGLVFLNYCCSKEIYVMEHEYYSGLSIALMCYYATVNMGPAAGKGLDEAIDAQVNEWYVGRKKEMAVFEETIANCTIAQEQAKGQKLLMDAKKENIIMQLEAIYRERMMHVYKMVKGRMDYHVKLYRAEARIHQRWMIAWILDNVMKSITPDFEQQALNSSIEALNAAASRA